METSQESDNPRTWLQHWDRGPAELADRFNALEPSDGLSLLKSRGFGCPSDPVNYDSVENRVFGYTLENADRIVLKVYRPGRWTREGLLDELEFIDELLSAGVTVVRPVGLPEGGMLGTWEGMNFVVFEFVAGVEDRTEPLDEEELRSLGRLAGRIHTVGVRKPALHRMPLEPRGMGSENLRYLAEGDMIPADLVSPYSEQARAVIDLAIPAFADVPLVRVHGDLGSWNLLWTDSGPVVMDFDDFAMAPAVQDLSTLHSGILTPWGNPREDPTLVDRLRPYFLEGYREVRELPEAHIRPLKHLRGLRTIWFDAWIQSRLHDPNFLEYIKDDLTRKAWMKRIQGFERLLVELRSES